MLSTTTKHITRVLLLASLCSARDASCLDTATRGITLFKSLSSGPAFIKYDQLEPWIKEYGSVENHDFSCL